MSIKTLLIDNYDSYTYNLYQLIAKVNGVPPDVIYNDQIDAHTLLKLINKDLYHNIVISPGPGSPTVPKDIGLCIQLIKEQPKIPIFGICLGFQALAVAYGAQIQRAPEPVHGRCSSIRHTGLHPLFHNIPSGSEYHAVRYHSLAIDESTLPPGILEPLAWTTDHSAQSDIHDDAVDHEIQHKNGVLMAIAHTSLPYYGVQYHPESIGTSFGYELFKNFLDLTLDYRSKGNTPFSVEYEISDCVENSPTGRLCNSLVDSGHSNAMKCNTKKRYTVLHKKVTLSYPSDPHRDDDVIDKLRRGCLDLFEQIVCTAATSSMPLHTTSCQAKRENTFWLDSASTERARFSFMGGQGGTLWHKIQYNMMHEGAIQHTALQEDCNGAEMAHRGRGGVLSITAATSIETRHHQASIGSGVTTTKQPISTSVWDWLSMHVDAFQCANQSALEKELPFNFWGGFVGYLGYELKSECGGSAAHAARTPDAAFFFIDRFLAIDHRDGAVYAVALYCCDEDENNDANLRKESQAWIDDTCDRICNLVDQHTTHLVYVPKSTTTTTTTTTTGNSLPDSQLDYAAFLSSSVVLREPKKHYMKNISSCMEALYAGESYELCLTTEITIDKHVTAMSNSPSVVATAITPSLDSSSGCSTCDPWLLYTALRKINPAPYGAWMQFSTTSPHETMSICCSSPERFLRGDRDGWLEAKPIKGTAARQLHISPEADRAAAEALASSEKDRAENLMIVDLLRNDLGRVCVPGSISVPSLMQIESFATVHQLVSTVRGKVCDDIGVVDAIKAAFPGGSMTGAPKVRSMEILDSLEGGARGVYSGSLGYLSVNGTFDLNIVIRTAVVLDYCYNSGPSCCSHDDGDTWLMEKEKQQQQQQQVLSIGAGGAIVVQSDVHEEFEEMMLKATPLLKATHAAMVMSTDRH